MNPGTAWPICDDHRIDPAALSESLLRDFVAWSGIDPDVCPGCAASARGYLAALDTEAGR